MLVADHHTLEQLQDLAQAIPQKRSWRRVQAVVLAKQGWTAPTSPRAWDARSAAVKNWVAQYNRGGIEALRERPRTGRPRSWTRSTTPGSSSGSTPRRGPRTASVPSGPPTSGGSSSRSSASLMSLQAVYDLLHRLGYSSLMPRPQHEDANPEVQEFFKEIVVEQIDAIAAEHPSKEVRVYFEDEARFGTQGTITRVWARKGSRPRAVRQNGREWLYVLMAVCAATGAASALIMPELNTAVVNLFLEQFSRELPAGVHAVLIWDGAGYHTGGDLVVPGNVSLIQLPPYSPELNPVENLWHYLRSHHWSNREYEGYKGLQEEADPEPACRV